MDDPKPKDVPESAADPAPERVPGQADDLNRGTGLGDSGGGLGDTTGFWPEKPAEDDLKKAGADPDFEDALDGSRKDR